jgi:hypothetical protein
VKCNFLDWNFSDRSTESWPSSDWTGAGDSAPIPALLDQALVPEVPALILPRRAYVFHSQVRYDGNCQLACSWEPSKGKDLVIVRMARCLLPNRGCTLIELSPNPAGIRA